MFSTLICKDNNFASDAQKHCVDDAIIITANLEERNQVLTENRVRGCVFRLLFASMGLKNIFDLF